MSEETVEATLSIELNVECPECCSLIDLMATQGLNDEGELVQEACPSEGHWSDAHDNFGMDFKCPDCKTYFRIEGIGW